MASPAIEQLRAERAAQRAATGYKPVTYAPPNTNPKHFGVEITPDSEEKSFGRKVLEDTALLAYGVPAGIAKIGVGLFTQPIQTVKELGGAIKQTGKDIVGVTGFLGEEAQKESIDYYKAHPVTGLLDAFGVASLGTGAVLKSALTSTARSAMSTAVRVAAKEGVEESVVRAAMQTTRSSLNPARIAGKERISTPFMDSLTNVVRTGETSKVATTLSESLVKRGVSQDVALRIAQETAKNVSESIVRQSGRLRTLDAITHPVSAAIRGGVAPTQAVSRFIFGSPEETAVGRLFGSDFVKANKKTALGMERWLEAVVREQGLENTVETRLRTLMEWKKSSEFANLTSEQFFRDFDKYVQADLSLRKLRELTNNNFVAVKALPKETTTAMAATLKDNIKTITDEIGELADETPQRKVDLVFDRISELMTQTFGRDFEKYAPLLREAYGTTGSLDNLEKAILSLSSRKPTISFTQWSETARKFAEEMEGTGYRVGHEPKGKPVSQVSDVVGDAPSVVSKIDESALNTQRTKIGKLLDFFGFSTRGVVEGTQEFMFRQSWIQHSLEKIKARTITIEKPIAVTTTTGVKNSVRKITIPTERLYQWLYEHRSEIFANRKGLGGFKGFRPVSVFDLTQNDLINIGIKDEKLVKAIMEISEKSLREIPASVIGVGEKLVNLLRTSDVGFAKFGTFYDAYLKSAFHLRYQSSLAIMFQAQQYIETKLMAAMLTKNAKMLPGVQGLAGFGQWMIPARAGGILKNAKTYLQKITKDPELSELVIARDELLPNVRKALEDTMDSPEFARIRSGVEGIARKTETGGEILSRQRVEAFWTQMFGGWSMNVAAKTGKAIAEKFGMTLEEAASYTMRDGKKIYNHPQVLRAMQDATQQVLHYKVGFQTSPLAKTLNIVFFPFRFQAKTIGVAANWLGTIPPPARAVVINNWVHFANWAGTDEGIEWRKTHKSLLYSILAYTTAWEQMGDAIDSVARGRLFGGQTGLIGGVPFGFVYNLAQELAILPDDPEQVDPATGRLFRFKEVPRELVSEAAFLTALEEFVFMLLPGMPLYTVTGGVIKGASYRKFMETIIESGWGWTSAKTKGEDPKRGKQMLERDFMRVKYGETRF